MPVLPPADKDGIRAWALGLGFDGVGFAPAGGDPAWERDLAAFIAEERHGEMQWMADGVERRARPSGLWPPARSIVMVAQSHAPADDPALDAAAPGRARICAYGRARDYHDVLGKRLRALARWLRDQYGAECRPFVDTSAVMEKPLGQQAGLGWQGRHTLLVSRRLGGWLSLGGVMTSLDIPPDPPERTQCGSCRACVDACPTGALDGTGRIDPRLCLSYHTIEARQPMPEFLRRAMGNRVYGCDACQAACPWTRLSRPADPRLLPRADLAGLDLAALAVLDADTFRALFAGTPVKRVGRDRFVATVLVAIANAGLSDLRPLVNGLRSDESPLVRAMADWAVSGFESQGASQL